MGDRPKIPVPVKCSATSKRSKKRCGRWATPGSAVCRAHGSLGGRLGKEHAKALIQQRVFEASTVGVAEQLARRQAAAAGVAPATLAMTDAQADMFVAAYRSLGEDQVTKVAAKAFAGVAQTIADRVVAEVTARLTPAEPDRRTKRTAEAARLRHLVEVPESSRLRSLAGTDPAPSPSPSPPGRRRITTKLGLNKGDIRREQH